MLLVPVFIAAGNRAEDIMVDMKVGLRLPLTWLHVSGKMEATAASLGDWIEDDGHCHSAPHLDWQPDLGQGPWLFPSSALLLFYIRGAA